ncbi:MAG TPA: hypothetical protein VNE17_10230 [Nitrolancea sp.]|nr:hypothetical protein [Nitrolancea sp.]
MRQRPDSLILIAVYELIMSAILLIVSCVVLPIALLLTPFGSGGFGDFLARFFVVGLVLAATFGIGIASGVVGIGLLLGKGWARVGAIALAILALFGFPIWTVIGILIIVYLLGEEGRSVFSPERHRAALVAEVTHDPSIWDVPTRPRAEDAAAHERDANAPDHSGANLPSLEPIKDESDQSADNDPDRPLPG